MRRGPAGSSASWAAPSARSGSSAIRARRAAPDSAAGSVSSDPGISWLTSRDRIAEQARCSPCVTGTLARIGNEVMELQRDEIGELREPTGPDVVGSITMPHKRNPERSEHLDTLPASSGLRPAC